MTSTTFELEQSGECAQHFKKRLGLYVDNEDLVVMRNVVMSPWPTDGNLIARLIEEFKRALNEEVQIRREQNDVSPTQHEFLLQGTNRLYNIHFPMLYLEKHRHQLIIELELSQEAKKQYMECKKANPTAIFTIKTTEELAISTLVAKKQTFKGIIESRSLSHAIEDVTGKVTHVVKDRSLKARFRDTSYPSDCVPFYLYGHPDGHNIDHILVRAPNIQLSADNVHLSLDKTLSPAALTKGAVLFIHSISEAAMQPFQSNEGPLGDTLATDSNFFFRPGQEFDVSVYEDLKDAQPPGPGILNVKESSLIGKGKLKLAAGRYVDSVKMNIRPFAIIESDENFKAWKKIFDQIGKELD